MRGREPDVMLRSQALAGAEDTVTDQDHPDDATLILAHRNGSPTALMQLWMRYDRMVYGAAHSMLSEREAAEDIRQDVFLKVYSQLDALKDAEKFGSWLHVITRNTCNTYLRRRKTTVAVDDLGESDHPVSPSCAADLEAREQRTWLRKAIDALPEDYRTAVELHYFEEQPLRQIALFFDIPESSVKWRLYRAREILKDMASDLK